MQKAKCTQGATERHLKASSPLDGILYMQKLYEIAVMLHMQQLRLRAHAKLTSVFEQKIELIFMRENVIYRIP